MKSSNLARRIEPQGADGMEGGIPRLAREVLARDARAEEARTARNRPAVRRRLGERAIVIRGQGLAPFRVR